MDISEIKNFLIQSLVTCNTDESENMIITEFINGLFNDGDVTSKRLILCLALDAKNSLAYCESHELRDNIFLTNLYDCILNAADCNVMLSDFGTEMPNRWKFAWAQRNAEIKNKTPCVSCTVNSEYSRVYSFSSYYEWVLSINKELNLGVDIADGDLEDIQRLFSKFKRNKNYSNCKITRLGYENFVFVAAANELRKLGYDKSNEIVDSLGLYFEDIAKSDPYVIMEYDCDFDEDTWQPDSMTGDWGQVSSKEYRIGNEFFLSFGLLDDFGRTYSISGTKKGLKERVHLPFDHKGNKVFSMKVHPLGENLGSIDRGSDQQIIVEGIKRFNMNSQ